MNSSRESRVSDLGPQSSTRLLYWMLVLLSLVPLCIVLPMAPINVGIGAIAGWVLLLWASIAFVRGQFHIVVPLWVAVYPYCYYLFTFPKEHSIFTVDRALIVLLVIEMLIISQQEVAPIPLMREVRISAYLWGLFLLVCLVSLALHAPSHELAFYRLLVEGMVMPALLGVYAMRHFPLLKDLRLLHTCACVLGLGLWATGLIELTTNIDLFPWEGSVPMFTETQLRRADGPFEQQVVLSMVAILAFFFIVYLRRLMEREVSGWRLLLHKAGCVASLGAALLPLNRGLVFALVPIAVIDSYSKHRLVRRRVWAAFFGIIVLGAVAAKLYDPRLFEDRVSGPENIYQRIAQHQETLRMVRDYPLFGVGLGLYHDVALQNPRYMAKWKGIESMTVQHNVLMTVLSDQGIVGLLFYGSAQLFFIRAMWKIRKVYPPGWLTFLYCVLIYFLIGLDFATVYFPDINLFYMLVLGLLYQQQIRMAEEAVALDRSAPAARNASVVRRE